MVGCGYDINEERKNRFNKDIAVKEIKILDFGVLLWAASVLKKEKEEYGGNTQAEDNEYCNNRCNFSGCIRRARWRF
jgi:hypothetical protein